MAILSKPYTITDAVGQVSDIDEMFGDLYRQLAVSLLGTTLGSAGSFLRSTGSAGAWSTLVLPDAITKGALAYGSATNVMDSLAAVATGKALISQGLLTAPGWGLIDAAVTLTGIAPVANGGSGRASHTAYAVLCGGTTTTAAQQSIAGVGTSGQILTSNGPGALPTFQTASSGGAPTAQTTVLTAAQPDFPFSAAYTYLRADNSSLLTFSGFSGLAGVTATGGDRAVIAAVQANVQILHQSALSASTNRVITPSGLVLTLVVGEQAFLIYDGTTSRWRCVAVTQMEQRLLNEQAVNIRSLTELTTIAAAATTDTTIQFPANSTPLGVSVRVTTAIPTAATFDVGDPTTPTLFNAALSVAANTTGKNPPSAYTRYTAATSVRLTPNISPAANTGRVRVTLHYIDFTVPTS